MAKESDDEIDRTPPGPTDHGREGGMATREVAPELAEKQGSKDTD